LRRLYLLLDGRVSGVQTRLRSMYLNIRNNRGFEKTNVVVSLLLSLFFSIFLAPYFFATAYSFEVILTKFVGCYLEVGTGLVRLLGGREYIKQLMQYPVYNSMAHSLINSFS